MRAESSVTSISFGTNDSPSQTSASHVRKVLDDVLNQLKKSNEAERTLLTAHRNRLKVQCLKLSQAHCALTL